MRHKPYECNRCKRRFTTLHGTRLHITTIHKGVGQAQKVPKKEPEEQSIAEMLIEGIIDGTWTEDGEYIGGYE